MSAGRICIICGLEWAPDDADTDAVGPACKAEYAQYVAAYKPRIRRVAQADHDGRALPDALVPTQPMTILQWASHRRVQGRWP
ncbi:hypothetical protein IMX07_10805 [bacterium]|jgi:hypothetical protein|nr:hypothetical protein [bacterium]